MTKNTVLLVLSVQLIIFAACSVQSNSTNSSGICYLPVYGRISQSPIQTCPDTDLTENYQCFPDCKEGYSPNTSSDTSDSSDSDPYDPAPPGTFYDSFCWQDCPAGFDDIPGGCAHLTPYGKNLDYETEQVCLKYGKTKKCEQCTKNGFNGWYPTSKCGTCTPYCPITSCPEGMTQNGSVCTKQFYNRTSLFALECPEGYEPVSNSEIYIYGTVCYPVAHTGFTCNGPVCTGTCPEGWQACSYNVCVRDSALCDNDYLGISEELAEGFDGTEGKIQLLTQADLADLPNELITIYGSIPTQPICPYQSF